MLIFVLLFVVVVISFGLGYFFLRYQSRRHLNISPQSWVYFSPSRIATAMIISVVVSYTLMTVANRYLPALNDPLFTQTGSVNLQNQKASISYQFLCLGFKCDNVKVDVLRKVNVVFEFPEWVPVDEEFVISATVTSRAGFPKGIYNAELFKPSSLEGRTTDICETGQEPKSLSVKACHSVESHTKSLRFRWTLSPSRTGQVQISVKSEDIQFQQDPKVETKGSIKVLHKDAEKILDFSNPTTQISNVELDGLRGEIRFDVNVLTSIGVDQTTYDLMKIIGAVISAMAALFGAGFVLKFRSMQT